MNFCPTRQSSEHSEPWNYQRLRYRLNTLIEVLPLAEGRDEHSRKLLANVHGDLIELRDGLEQWHGEGIFKQEGKEGK